MRRSRRKGQLRRTSSMRRGSHSTIRVSSAIVWPLRPRTCPNGSATKDEPQNSMPLSGGPSKPTRLTAATKMPLAMACERWMVRQASSCAAPNSRFLRGMPADGRGIEQDVRAAQAGQARGFGIPLVPADQDGDAAVARVEAGEAQIAGREIKFLVVERVVGDVHLAVDAEQRAVGVDHRGGVVIEAGGAALEERGDDDHAQLGGQLAERLGRGPGDGLGQVEAVVIFLAAKILRAEQFLQADDLRAAPGGFADALMAVARFSRDRASIFAG